MYACPEIFLAPINIATEAGTNIAKSTVTIISSTILNPFLFLFLFDNALEVNIYNI